MRILLVTPPMVQINAPYPATAYLAGFLKEHGYVAGQFDASLALALKLFSRAGLREAGRAIRRTARSLSVRQFRARQADYLDTIEAVVRFLQGKDPTLAHRIVSRRYLPEGPRFGGLEAPADVHGTSDLQDFAVHLASLYLDDISDAIRDGVDSRFELSRYGEKLAASAASFDGLASALRRKASVLDRWIDELAESLVRDRQPELVGITIPFPGNVYAAFRMARCIRRISPGTTLVLGGGYVNTELRELSDPRVFDYVDFVVLDQGESALLWLIRHLEERKLPLLRLIEGQGRDTPADLPQTFFRSPDGMVVAPGKPAQTAEPAIFATPDFGGLHLADYVSMAETPNPMHRLWSCGRWNKIRLAQGCYWKRCAFCDTSLDYIARYLPTPADQVIRQIEAVIGQTGQTGFHFVDEALPPGLLRQVAERLIGRKLQITWWGNIRFDRTFTPELVRLLARSGCVAVTGGLEAANNRLLALLDKGFTTEEAVPVLRAFSEAGILVHAYLMYGCPSQTEQDTVDGLEFVRQLFECGYLQSAYWHRFALTVHSPVYRSPGRYGVRLLPLPEGRFARNEAPYRDVVECNHEALGRGLRKALFNYMHGVGLENEMQSWFSVPVPPPAVPTDYVARITQATSG